MFLCGLWHGAGWNFAIWGLWHWSGPFTGAGLIAASALVSVLVPSAHEIRDRLEKAEPRPWFAAAAASLSVYCVLEVGRGAPVSFIYFQF